MDLRWTLRIAEERRDGVVILSLTGRLGATTAAPLGAALTGAVGRGDARIVIDLTGVDYISSAGLNALTAASGLCAGSNGALVLCGLTDPVRIALDLGGVLSDIAVESSREKAILKMAAPPTLG